MPKKEDFTEVAFRVFQRATHQECPAEQPEPLSPKAAAGQKGGKVGGRARAATMTAEERSASAKKAAAARWKKPSP
ncbi:MAG: histone H1 [Acidobacteriota bacterium]